MTSRSGRSEPKRKWFQLALRHLRMAQHLLDSGFPDGAAFHSYHAFECVLSTFIAAQGHDVPPEGWTALTAPDGTTIQAYPTPAGRIEDRNAHKARIIFFRELAKPAPSDPPKPYFVTFSTLRRFLSVRGRNDTLYYDVNHDRLPHQVYPHSQVAGQLLLVRQFAREVWEEIR